MTYSPPFEFLLSSDDSRARVRRQLAEHLNIRTECSDGGMVIYDTFDWLLHRAGWSLEFVRGAEPRARLLRIADGLVVEQPIEGVPPAFSEEWPRGPVKAVIDDITEVRALLPLATLGGSGETLAVLNHDGKIVCRVLLEMRQVDKPLKGSGGELRRLRLIPMRGWMDEAATVAAALAGAGFLPATTSTLDTVLAAVGRVARDYSQKFRLELDPVQPAEDAARAILSQLFKDLVRNEDGTRRDIDPEFLHDFRVAVRRTRSALSVFRPVFGRRVLEPFVEEFRALGSLTGKKRDLDVHLIDFDAHLELLDDDQRKALGALRGTLEAKRDEAAGELARHLKGAPYRAFKRQWREFLDGGSAQGKSAAMPIKEFADRVQWKTFRDILRQGRAIGRKSPDEALHELRKQCKKFRYLMEFFQSMYSKKSMKSAIKELKQLQDQLGLFQDQCVQIDTLEAFLSDDIAPAARQAIDHLLGGLSAQRRRTRAGFGDYFRRFDTKDNRARYAALFKP